jgi:hypothetical protein
MTGVKVSWGGWQESPAVPKDFSLVENSRSFDCASARSANEADRKTVADAALRMTRVKEGVGRLA